MRSTLFLIAITVSACASPPIGLGTGALRPGGPGATGAVMAGGAGYAASGTRTTFQAEASASYQRHRRGSRTGYGLDVGMVYTQLAERAAGEPEVSAGGGFPYLRPRLMAGPWSLAVAVAGLGIGAGGGGLYGGIADVQLGYGTPAWSVYAGAYSLVWDVTGGDRTVAKQARLGGEYVVPAGSTRLGLALEIYGHDDALVDRTARPGRQDQRRRVDSRFIGAGFKLRIASRLLQ